MVWDHTVADYKLGYRYTSGPIVVKGKIVAGMTGCERYKNDVCFISAHDPQTGKELWRTSTIARPGEPGGDTWGDLPLMFRAGGDAWIPGSYDPATNLSTGRPRRPSRGRGVTRRHDGDALYTNSILALDPDDRQDRLVPPVHPGRDPRPGRSLREHPGRPRGTPVAVQDGQARHSLGAGSQDRQVPVGATISATRRSSIRSIERAVDLSARRCCRSSVSRSSYCPSIHGMKNWRAMAYHPESRRSTCRCS